MARRQLTLYEITKKEKIIAFLDTKIKSNDKDPDRRWITTWNDYLGRIKFFVQWLHNHYKKKFIKRNVKDRNLCLR